MINVTIKEMLIYVEVALENLEETGRKITKDELLKELNFLSYHKNKKSVLQKKDYKEKFF